MKKQNYSNHTRYYVPHHFIFYPLIFALFMVCGSCIFLFPDRWVEWSCITALVLFMGWLSFMLRQHYALGNQNRIVRLELRLRYYQLTHKRFEEIEQRLSFSQLAALRFASDEELLVLIQRTVDEDLSPTAIKRSIINWLPDNMRV